MSDDKLESFGSLLERTLINRGQEEIKPVDSPIELSDSERSEILERLSQTRDKGPLQPPSSGPESGSDQDLSTASFGSLLEKTIELQEKLKKDESSENDEIREAVIEKSNIDMVNDLLKRFIR
jgi:hypothetical protein